MLVPKELVVVAFTIWVIYMLYRVHVDARKKRKEDPETYRSVMILSCLAILVLAITCIIVIGE